MKRVMILGGGVNQLGLLRAGKALGYEVLLCDKNPNCIGKTVADRFFCIDIIDANIVYAIAKSARIDGIISNSEAVMQVVAEVAERLELVGNPKESIAVLQSKYGFRQAQQAAGLYAPQHRIVDASADLSDYLLGLHYPVIVKPVQCSGTRGTTRFDTFNAQAMTDAVRECCHYSRNHICMVEEYVPMPSLTSIEGDVFLDQGHAFWGGLFFTQRSAQLPMVPMTYMSPYRDTTDRMTAVQTQIKAIFDSLRIVHGQFNIEAYFDDQNRLFVIEINARQGGHGLPAYVQLATGVNMDQLLLSTCVGDHSLFDVVMKERIHQRFAVRHTIFSDTSGTFQGLEINHAVAPYVVDVEMEKQAGDRVEKRINGSSCLGFANLVFPDYEMQHYYGVNMEQFIVPVVR